MTFRTCRALTVVFALALCAPLFAEPRADAKTTCPAQILIIRHAEKPPVEAKSVDLSPEGKERANALPRLFNGMDQNPAAFPKPDFLFATKNSKHSHRPLETIEPLAKTLKLPINANFDNESVEKLAQEILHNPKYAGKTVLISWHHGTIPQLAKQLKATDVPESWKGTAFDRVWQITYNEKGEAAFRDRPQHLLSRDADK